MGIRELQRKNCRVFALTARYVQLAERTHRVLESLGVNFQESAPFPAHPIQDPVTKAVVMNGIVYCNGADKGAILSRLLTSVILPREQKEARNEKRTALAGLRFVYSERPRKTWLVLLQVCCPSSWTTLSLTSA